MSNLLPDGFDNTVIVTAADAASINAELATMNAADYLATDIKFDGSHALLLFGKNVGADFVASAPQKVNVVAATQVALDADKATEAADGYVPTGVFADGTTVLVLYQQLGESSE